MGRLEGYSHKSGVVLVTDLCYVLMYYLYLKTYCYKINKCQSNKGQLISKGLYSILNSSKNQTKISIRGIIVMLGRIFSFFRSFFGRIEDTKTSFRNYFYKVNEFQSRISNFNEILFTCHIIYRISTNSFLPSIVSAAIIQFMK